MNKSFQVIFILRHDKIDKQKRIPIYLRITLDGDKTEISLKKKIANEQWNLIRGEPKQNTQDLIQLSLYLNSQKNLVHDVYSELSITRQYITLKKLKDRLLGNEINKDTLIALAQHHNIEFENLIGVKYSYGSYKNYKTSLLYLVEFVKKKYKKNDIALHDLDYEFVEKYYNFLVSNKPCNQNGAAKHIQRLKKIINYGIRIGVIDKNPFLSFQVTFKPYSRAILTWGNISSLLNTPLNTNSLMTVRDIFLFQCFTGLAYVDIKNLTYRHIVLGVDGKQWIVIDRHKTLVKSSIPLLDEALIILNRYNKGELTGRIFPVPSNQKMNKYLKAIAEVSKIEIVLSTHVARHTFATVVTLNNDVPIETVSKMLGHTNLKTTQLYAKVQDVKIGNDMEKLRVRLSNKKTGH